MEIKMTPDHIATARAYYTAMGEKNLEDLDKFLHTNVQFTTPFGQMTGKESVLGAAKGFFGLFKKLTIGDVFGMGNKVMLTYDLELLPPLGSLSAAVHMTFQDDGLISKIHLFYDARPFNQ